jgi:copper transport outer membrane protein MctB
MMDLRYHLASLMSVFLALAVGIIVGVSLGSSERQAATIRRLQEDVAAIRAEDSHVKEVNADLQHRLTTHEAAEQQDLLPLVVRGRLAGNRVALLLTGGDAAEDLRAPLTRALRYAGAEVLAIRLPRGEGAPPETPGAIKPAAARDEARSAGPPSSSRGPRSAPIPAAAPDPAETEASMLARAFQEGRPALLDELRTRMPDLEVIGDLHAPIHRWLLLCPNDQPEYARRVAAGGGIEAALARAAQQSGALLVAGEPEALPDSGGGAGAGAAGSPRSHETASLLPALAGLGATTVDDVETTAGQMAAVLALAGAHGSFGTGPSATRLLPAGDSHPSPPLPHP